MPEKKQVIVRFAPSPTGFLHIGGARTALFNYLFAKNNNGKFLLRMEDTDRERSKNIYATDIIDGLKWLGLPHDDDVVVQSKRADIYKKYLNILVSKGSAYVSDESLTEDDASSKNKTRLRKQVIRFNNPNKKVTFKDIIRGEIVFDSTELGNFVIAKSLEEPVYHLAVVADDYEMNITHVIRAEDHISNTPRQILLQEALGFPQPRYAHIPLILASDRSKLSKRHGAISVLEYKNMGYLPEALVNYLSLLGWNPGNDSEMFDLEQLIKYFDISKVQKGGAIFNIEKLDWFNREYLKKLNVNEIENVISSALPNLPQNSVKSLAPVIIERIYRLHDIDDLIKNGDFDFLAKTPTYESNRLIWKDSNKDETGNNLKQVKNILESMDSKLLTKESVKSALWDFASEKGRGNVLWPLRFALSGKDKSPDPFILIEILGKDETILRIDRPISLLRK